MGYYLRMHSEIRDRLTDLRATDPEISRVVGEAVVALLDAGESLGPPLVLPLESVLRPPDDPQQALDYSYQRQLDVLQKVRRGVADLATSRKRVELQVSQLRQSAAKLASQRRDALDSGKEDLAREARAREAGVQDQLSDLGRQLASLKGEEERLIIACRRLQARVDAFRTKRETIKASYTAAEAETHINEAVSGISGETGDVGVAVQRAQDRTEQLQARAGALDELLASGALHDATSPVAHDELQSQLDAVATTGDVEAELARIRAELAQAPAPPALEEHPAPPKTAPAASQEATP